MSKSKGPDPGRRALVQGAAGCAWLSALPLWAQGSANRVALVIGNAAYAGAPLPNAANDAKAMSSALRSMGFEVVELRDAGKQRIEEALALSRAMLQGRNGVGLLYYAGHGLQVDWRNYMLPVDAAPESAAEVSKLAVDLQAVIDAFRSAGNRMNIVVLDACRNNPFGASTSGRGLAPLDAPPGTYLAYATAPGNVAEDGSEQDGNGLYTRFLVKELQRPDAKIEDVFKRVRLQVRHASKGRQVPWDSSSLEHDFVFATGARADAATMAQREADFDAEKAEWDRIKASTRPEDFYVFLGRYPNGRISELAQFRLDQLARPAVQAAPLGGLRVLPSGVDRYQVGDAWVMEREDRSLQRTIRVRYEVTSIEGPLVIVNGGGIILDQMGGIVKNLTGAKDPALLAVPADIQLGKRWRSAVRNRLGDSPPTETYYDYHVAALEDIEPPAGRFRAYRIEAAGQNQSSDRVRRLRTKQWVDPETMWLVRSESRQTSEDGSQVFLDFTDVLITQRRLPRVRAGARG